MRHVSSRSGVATLQTAIHLLLTDNSFSVVSYSWYRASKSHETSRNSLDGQITITDMTRCYRVLSNLISAVVSVQLGPFCRVLLSYIEWHVHCCVTGQLEVDEMRRK